MFEREYPPLDPSVLLLVFKRTHRNATAVIMKMAYGYTVGPDDPFVQLAEESSRISGWATAPGMWLVDYFPVGS
jgi:hypothetical protein